MADWTCDVNVTVSLSPTLEGWVKAQTSTTNNQLALILANQRTLGMKLDAAIATETKEMAALDDAISSLTTQVASNTSVQASALVLINGFSVQLATAVAAAQAAGASTTQLASLTALQSTIKANDDELAAAVAAGTPAAPPSA